MKEEEIRNILTSVCDEMIIKHGVDYNTANLFYSLFLENMGEEVKFIHIQDTGINAENIMFGICGSLFVIVNKETKKCYEIPYLQKFELNPLTEDLLKIKIGDKNENKD